MRNHLAALAVLLLAACAGPTPYQNADITGTVSWSERVTYGPDATLYVYLVDVSGPDSPLQVELQKFDNPEPGAELLAASTIEGMIPSPTRFSLVVPLDQVDEGHDYALKAAIVDQGLEGLVVDGDGGRGPASPIMRSSRVSSSATFTVRR